MPLLSSWIPNWPTPIVNVNASANCARTIAVRMNGAVGTIQEVLHDLYQWSRVAYGPSGPYEVRAPGPILCGRANSTEVTNGSRNRRVPAHVRHAGVRVVLP